MGSEVAAALIGAGGAIVGAGVGAGATLRAVRPYRQQAALERSGNLVARRYESYSRVVRWMRPYFDDLGDPQDVAFEQRKADAQQLRTWYYEEGGGLLMSGETLNAYRAAVRALLDETETVPKHVSDALSALRTELKIDIGSREPPERERRFATSDERTW